MTTWANVRSTLRTRVAAGLSWPEAMVHWHTDPMSIDGTFARLSAVSDLTEGERAPTIDANTNTATTHEDHRAQVDVLLEDYEGEGAHDLAESLRTYFAHMSTKQALQLAGIALVMEPGPVRDASYLHDGYWISAATFELPIRFRKETADPVAVKPTETVEYDGTLDTSVPLSGSVDKP